MKKALLALLPVLLLTSACAGRSAANNGAAAEAFDVQRAPEALRVMTFNIQSGHHGLEKVAAVIRKANPDVVALQEVDKGTTRARGLNQAAELARLTGLTHHAHFRAATLHGGDYGLAVISKYPIVETRHLRLPNRRGEESRAVARTVVDVEGTQVSVYVTHLSHLPQRADLRIEQAQAIARLIQRDRRPALLMGDLNDAPDSAAVLMLRKLLPCVFNEAGVGRADTYPLPFPLANLRLDYVLASKEFSPRRAFVLRELASDHYPIVADLELLPSRGRLATLQP